MTKGLKANESIVRTDTCPLARHLLLLAPCAPPISGCQRFEASPISPMGAPVAFEDLLVEILRMWRTPNVSFPAKPTRTRWQLLAPLMMLMLLGCRSLAALVVPNSAEFTVANNNNALPFHIGFFS